MSLRQSLSDTVRDKGRSSVSISPAIGTVIPAQSSGGTGLGMAKKSMGSGMGSMSKGPGMGAKNGVGFPKKASMASGGSGIKGPTKLGRDIRGSMK